MTPCRAVLAALLLLAVPVLLAGCTAPPSSTLALTQTGFSDLPSWDTSAPDAAAAAFRRGCVLLDRRPDTASMGGAGYAGTAGDWRTPCAAAPLAASSGAARAFFESQFIPYRVDAAGDGLFTGYYEPEIAVAPARGGIYQTPIYGLPSDLVRVDLGAFLPSLAGQHIVGKRDGAALVPYAARTAIDAKGVDAPVLFYAADPVALFFLQIQGSGRARLPDGHMVRLAYAGTNGRPYTAIGRTLIAKGALTPDAVSLQSIRAWLAAHPGEAQGVMESDDSYVFFQQTPLGDAALGSPGTLGATLTPLGSLAVDARLHALGAPFFVAAEGPDPVHGLLVAQDTGGAIKGAVRGDVFFGFGAQAEARAGLLKAPGRLFVLLPRALAARLGPHWQAPS